ncbi:hypothetical protein AAC03nite_16750 [Alicyclobacillus acidoterrestris]|nr:hypothetical protein AAC03nite_16750 [Alicyclobacillus acidoterrestris]
MLFAIPVFVVPVVILVDEAFCVRKVMFVDWLDRWLVGWWFVVAFWVVHPDRVMKDKPVANAMQHNMVGFMF